MTIRTTLLRAFLLIGLVPAIFLAALAFVKARQAMQREIDSSLVSQAEAVASDINKILFERLQNAATWSTLEVMQDVQVQDVDKRLSNFLAKLKQGYGGVYRQLAVVDRGDTVIASSESGMLGRLAPAPTVWKRVNLAGAALTLARPARPGSGQLLLITAPLRNQFNQQPQGQLRLAFDWDQINALLDHVATGGRVVLLLDDSGQVLAASQQLRARIGTPGSGLSGWRIAGRSDGAFVQSGVALAMPDVLAGLGRAPGYAGFAGIGLSVLVIQPQSEALLPVLHMAEISLAILLALVLGTLLVASKVSRAIAQPLARLTEFTRHYKLGQDPQSAPPAARGEVGELGEAFRQMMRDIDQARQGLVQASKLAMIGEMASVIIHEVRTPLGILRSSAQVLRREPGLSPQAGELLGFIESETERLNRLVSTMLDSARPRPLRKMRTNLHQLIRQTGLMLSTQLEQRQIALSERLAAADPWLECDAEQIIQVLLNLIHNALQILPPGGRIRVATSERERNFVIELADDGPGIAPAERSRVFEAFFFQREGGVGLGLAIVQQIVLAHGGQVMVDDSEYGGARFTLFLPRSLNGVP